MDIIRSAASAGSELLAPALLPVKRSVDRVQSLLIALSIAMAKFWLVMFLVIGALCWMVFVATATYFYLYQQYVPTMYHSVPVHFDFTHPEFGPYAYADLVHPQYAFTNYSALASHPHTVPASPEIRMLTPGQGYDIELRVTMPDSESNQRLAMINVKTDVLHRHIHTNGNGGREGAAAAAAAAATAAANRHSAEVKPGHYSESQHSPHEPSSAWVHHPPHSAPPPLPHTRSTAAQYYQQQLSSEAATPSHHSHSAVPHHPATHHHTQPGITHLLLATSLRSFTLPYRAWITRVATQLIWLLPAVLIGWAPQHEHHLVIPVMEQFVESNTYSADLVRVHLLAPGSAAATSGHGGEDMIRHLQLYDVSLTFHTRLRGVSYFLYHWFISSAALGITMLVGLQCFLGSVLILWVYSCFRAARQHEEAERDELVRGHQQQHYGGNGSGAGGGADDSTDSPPASSVNSGSGGGGASAPVIERKSAPASAPSAPPAGSSSIVRNSARSRTPNRVVTQTAASDAAVIPPAAAATDADEHDASAGCGSGSDALRRRTVNAPATATPAQSN